ncbi:hypothetical protein MHBO_000432 [Bonamia ostreae]|uniref:UBP-type domain-containing protein n=1 Tax=Bonamia ostreae TaxID=126728 RepID=A0ABV2AFP5_9EUKA
MLLIAICDLTNAVKNDHCINISANYRIFSLNKDKNPNEANNPAIFYFSENIDLINYLKQQQKHTLKILRLKTANRNCLFALLKRNKISSPLKTFEYLLQNNKVQKKTNIDPLAKPILCDLRIFENNKNVVDFKKIKILSQITKINAFPKNELPNCPNCYYRLDGSIIGNFELAKINDKILLKSNKKSCQVCKVLEEEKMECINCENNEDLWVCLICATIGCSRYQKQHSKKHFEKTGHRYTIKMPNKAVWDYETSSYVHKLIGDEHKNDTNEETFDIMNAKTESISCSLNELLCKTLEDQNDYLEEKLEKSRIEEKNKTLLILEKIEKQKLKIGEEQKKLEKAKRYFNSLCKKEQTAKIRNNTKVKNAADLTEENRILIKTKKDFRNEIDIKENAILDQINQKTAKFDQIKARLENELNSLLSKFK